MKKIFWQYPVITEESFAKQQVNNKNYFAFPWATVIDKKLNIGVIYQMICKVININNFNITCCQHIFFRKLIPLFKSIGIRVLYTPHKQINEDIIDGILIKPCPLYAVNIENNSKNNTFKNKEILDIDRKYLYSFQGAYQQDYLTDIREKILELPDKGDTYIKNIGGWHFNEIVYSDKQNEEKKFTESDNHKNDTEFYNNLLLNSKFSLCPSGTGPNSIRFWESLAIGSIPVLLSDSLELPNHPLWDKTIIKLKESDINKVDEILRSKKTEEIKEMQKNCIEIYKYFRNNYINTEYDSQKYKYQIIHYCCGSYDIGDFGGVARYDYHIKKVFQTRKFFRGPQEKDKMLDYLKFCDNPLIITDNHLSCDIPNDYYVYIVHHGVAKRTATMNPEWDPYWKNLCVNGQDKMLKYRNPDKTTFISISKFVKDEFLKFYGDEYNNFNNVTVLHTSELDESKFKIYNNLPDDVKNLQVLGNFGSYCKGNIDKLINSKLSDEYDFNQLDIKMQSYRSINKYNMDKQQKYIDSDMFLQLSNTEGFSYATLDAMLCGLVIIGTPVGILYEVPDDCFVKIEIDKIYDISYMSDKLNHAWKNRKVLSGNIRKYYTMNCASSKWITQMISIANSHN